MPNLQKSQARPRSRRRRTSLTRNNRQQLFRIITTISTSDLTTVIFLLLLLIGLAQLLTYIFVQLRQPRVIGEILAGIVLGQQFWDGFKSLSLPELSKHYAPILNFVYWMCLLLLIFMSGAETKRLFSRDERREVSWLTIVGTGIPFIISAMMRVDLSRTERSTLRPFTACFGAERSPSHRQPRSPAARYKRSTRLDAAPSARFTVDECPQGNSSYLERDQFNATTQPQTIQLIS